MSLPRRAMTLIELLASLVLLSLVASVCVPIFQQSSRLLRLETANSALSELHADLSRLASDLIAEPKRFGIENDLLEGHKAIPWPDGTHASAVVIEPIAQTRNFKDQSKTVGGWIRFSCEACEVYRWVRVSETQGSGQSIGVEINAP
jgi:prepilin-type N-terminal cleavage/methylation domain-containing protein